jgi:ribosomal protein S18 acetylase RimI-like enzyme
MLTIRRARWADLPLLDTLEKEFDRDQRRIVLAEMPRLKLYLLRTPELNRITAKRFRKWVRSKKAIVLIAEIDSTAVGFSTISIETIRGLLPKRFGWIGYLFVSRQYRGQRISSRMLKELLSWLGKRRIGHVNLSVLADNRHARAIYKRWGFHDSVVFMWKLR